MSHAFVPTTSPSAASSAEQISAIVHDFWGPDVRAIQQIEAVPRILKTVCLLTGMGFASVARITSESWICCASYDAIGFGMKPGTELDLQSTLCKDICHTAQPIVIDEVAFDVTFADHPTPRLFRFQSHVSFPIIQKDGTIFGTLCAIDPSPKRVSSPEIVATFRLFADLIASELDLANSLAANRAGTGDGRASQGLRDQFVAVLTQNVREPIRSLTAKVQQLAQHTTPQEAAPVVESIRADIERVSSRIDDVLDFARGRLGGGHGLQRRFKAAVESELKQVVDQYRASSRSVIDMRLDLSQPVNCDARRIGQMLSNFLNNALAYGTAGAPIRVEATTAEDTFALSVTNVGEPIAADTLARLFQPFYKHDASDPRSQAVGLGLFIASEIARAHGGKIVTESDGGVACFTFTMPLWPSRPSAG